MIFWSNESKLRHFFNESIIPMAHCFFPAEELGFINADTIAFILQEIENALEKFVMLHNLSVFEVIKSFLESFVLT